MKRAAYGALALGSPVLLATLLIDHPAAQWGAALLVACFPGALAALAAGEGAGERGTRRALTALTALLAAALLGVLALDRIAADGPRLAGLPPSTALMLLGLAAVPLVAVALAYARGWNPVGQGDSGRSPVRDGREPRA